MNRSQDTVIDDDEETCPLCIEEFDLSDKNFRPCPCGYQICQFCFNSLKTTYEKSTCPNCRRPYDEKTIQYKIPTAEEFKLDQLNKNKKQAAAKRKETEKREVENSSRRNLAGVRVKQQNLVYVIGLIPQIKDEQALLQTLRGPDYFGQYGEIEKIVVSKTKPGAANQGIGVYVTYARKEDAALCINTVDGSPNGDRVLRAQFGTTKYCSAYLRGETCNNKNCSFLHETGEDGQHTSLQNEPHGARLAQKPVAVMQTTQLAPARPLSATQITAAAQPMVRQDSKEDESSRKNSHDSSALPSTASWANTNAPVARTRRASQANSRATPSPQMTYALLSSQKTEESKPKEAVPNQPSAVVSKKATPKSDHPLPKPKSKPVDHVQQQYDAVLRSVSSNFRFVYDDSCLSPEVRATIDDMPPLIDPYGGAKRRAMRERDETERSKLEVEARAKMEAQATSAIEDALEEDNIVAGSLALGGEPEEDHRSSSARGAIGRPQTFSDQNSRSMTPQLRQQLSFLSTGNGEQASETTTQNTAFEMSDFDRRGPQYSQAQYEQINNHQRHGSRYFNNDSKASSGSRFQGQQSTYYSSGVQGPPPGLPTAGTPPVSGGGMFAHGQNFTNPGFGTTKEANTEAFSRNRSGTNQGHETSKRGGVEHLADPSIVSTRVHQGNTTGQGLFGGQQVDEKNFPSLPLRSDTQPSALHSRVSSYHSLQSSGLRSSTPKIPPGFELTHGHPVPLSRQESPGQVAQSGSISAAIVAPAIPMIPMGPQSTQRPAALLGRKTSHEAGEISLGSPKVRSTRLKPEAERKLESSSKGKEWPEHKDESPIVATAETRDKIQLGGRKSESLDVLPSLVTNVTTATSVPSVAAGMPEKSATPILDLGGVGTPGTWSPRSTTPANTTPSETPKTATARPRTLRVTTGMPAKVAEPAPSATLADRSSILPGPISLTKRGSRRMSFSSTQLSRPSTPALSELHSNDVSRASSPPPSIVGSAPERVKSKNQQKKDRRDKAKKTPQPNEPPVSASTTPIAEPVAPVIARQKKQKKRLESGTTDSVEERGSSTASPKPQEAAESQEIGVAAKRGPAKSQNEIKPVSAGEKVVESATSQSQRPKSPPPATSKDERAPRAQERPKAPYTLRDLYHEVGNTARDVDTPSTVQKLLSEHISPMPKIISSLIQSGDLSKDNAWLNPPNFNSAAYKLASDSRRGQEYLDGNWYSATDAFGYIYLPSKEKQALKNGHAVSIADVGDRKDDLLKRCLVMPNGWVLRHLNASESIKALEMEERRQMYVEEFGDVGTMEGLGVLEADDFSNLGGGMKSLRREGERHGIVWVTGDGEEMGEDDEFDAFDEEDGDIGINDVEELELDEEDMDDEIDEVDLDDNVNMPGAWDLPPSGTNKPLGSSSGRATSMRGLGPHSKTNALRLPSTNAPATTQRQSSVNGNAPTAPTTAATTTTTTATATNQSPSPTPIHPMVNIRTLDAEMLQKRVVEKQKELEQTRKEMEKIEKLWNKKSKDIGRWREGLVKA